MTEYVWQEHKWNEWVGCWQMTSSEWYTSQKQDSLQSWGYKEYKKGKKKKCTQNFTFGLIIPLASLLFGTALFQGINPNLSNPTYKSSHSTACYTSSPVFTLGAASVRSPLPPISTLFSDLTSSDLILPDSHLLKYYSQPVNPCSKFF